MVKIKIKSANEIELRQFHYLASVFGRMPIFFSLQPSASANYENGASVIHCVRAVREKNQFEFFLANFEDDFFLFFMGKRFFLKIF